jgi:hypothetical protein
MKSLNKLLGWPLAIAGFVVICWAGIHILLPKSAIGSTVLGFNPIHAGLAGVAAMTLGLLFRNE